MPSPGGLLADVKASRGTAKSPSKLRSQIAAASATGDNNDSGSSSSGLFFDSEGAVSTLGTLSCFSTEDRQIIEPIHEWMIAAEPSLTGESSSVSLCLHSMGPADGKPVLCIHGLGKDRSSAFFAGFWPALVGSGHRVIALDLPGHGKASASKPLAARGSKGGDLILAILRTFHLTNVHCMTDAGGASAFLRAFKQAPTLFAAHHILLNPITTEAGGSVRDISFQATPQSMPKCTPPLSAPDS